jgi:hypothetical protein
MEKAGQTVAKAGDTAFAAGLRQQGIQNEADAKAADAGLSDDMRTTLFDPKTGYYAKRGKDAIDAAPAVLQALDELKATRMQALTSPEAQRMYGDIATRRIESAQTQISSKVLIERNAYADQAAIARTKSAIDDTISNFNNPKLVDQGLATIRSNITGQADINREDSPSRHKPQHKPPLMRSTPARAFQSLTMP